MRTYHLKNIFKNMGVNWKIYLVLFLELCLCFSLIYIGINENISHGKRAELLSYDQDNNIHTLQYRDKEGARGMRYEAHSPVLNSEELKTIEANRDIQGFYYAEITRLSYFVPAGTIESVDVVIANRSFFEQYLDVTDVKGECCYIIPELLSELKREFQRAPFDDAQFNGDSIVLNEKEFDFYCDGYFLVMAEESKCSEMVEENRMIKGE